MTQTDKIENLVDRETGEVWDEAIGALAGWLEGLG